MIYRVTIPNFDNFRDEVLQQVRDTVSEICRWQFDRNVCDSLALVSDRVNKNALDSITGALIAAHVQYTVEDLGSEYEHYITTAPEAYDYAGTCIPLGYTSVMEHGGTGRHIALLKNRKEYQIGRNASGLHPTKRVE